MMDWISHYKDVTRASVEGMVDYVAKTIASEEVAAANNSILSSLFMVFANSTSSAATLPSNNTNTSTIVNASTTTAAADAVTIAKNTVVTAAAAAVAATNDVTAAPTTTTTTTTSTTTTDFFDWTDTTTTTTMTTGGSSSSCSLALATCDAARMVVEKMAMAATENTNRGYYLHQQHIILIGVTLIAILAMVFIFGFFAGLWYFRMQQQNLWLDQSFQLMDDDVDDNEERILLMDSEDQEEEQGESPSHSEGTEQEQGQQEQGQQEQGPEQQENHQEESTTSSSPSFSSSSPSNASNRFETPDPPPSTTTKSAAVQDKDVGQNDDDDDDDDATQFEGDTSTAPPAPVAAAAAATAASSSVLKSSSSSTSNHKVMSAIKDGNRLYRVHKNYDAKLMLAGGIPNLSRFYKLQLLVKKEDDGWFFYLANHWGRLGEEDKGSPGSSRGFSQIKGPYKQENQAIQEFSKVFYMKTGNIWGVTTPFVPYGGKYQLVETSTTTAEENSKDGNKVDTKDDNNKDKTTSWSSTPGIVSKPTGGSASSTKSKSNNNLASRVEHEEEDSEKGEGDGSGGGPSRGEFIRSVADKTAFYERLNFYETRKSGGVDEEKKENEDTEEKNKEDEQEEEEVNGDDSDDETKGVEDDDGGASINTDKKEGKDESKQKGAEESRLKEANNRKHEPAPKNSPYRELMSAASNLLSFGARSSSSSSAATSSSNETTGATLADRPHTTTAATSPIPIRGANAPAASGSAKGQTDDSDDKDTKLRDTQQTDPLLVGTTIFLKKTSRGTTPTTATKKASPTSLQGGAIDGNRETVSTTNTVTPCPKSHRQQDAALLPCTNTETKASVVESVTAEPEDRKRPAMMKTPPTTTKANRWRLSSSEGSRDPTGGSETPKPKQKVVGGRSTFAKLPTRKNFFSSTRSQTAGAKTNKDEDEAREIQRNDEKPQAVGSPKKKTKASSKRAAMPLPVAAAKKPDTHGDDDEFGDDSWLVDHIATMDNNDANHAEKDRHSSTPAVQTCKPTNKGFHPDPQAQNVRPPSFPKEEEEQVDASLRDMPLGYAIDNIEKGRAAFLCPHCNWCKYFKSSDDNFNDFKFLDYDGKFIVDFTVSTTLEEAQQSCTPFNKWRRHMRTHANANAANPFGRKKHLPVLYGANPMIKGAATAAAVSPEQSGSSAQLVSVENGEDDNRKEKLSEKASTPEQRKRAKVGQPISKFAEVAANKGAKRKGSHVFWYQRPKKVAKKTDD